MSTGTFLYKCTNCHCIFENGRSDMVETALALALNGREGSFVPNNREPHKCVSNVYGIGELFGAAIDKSKEEAK